MTLAFIMMIKVLTSFSQVAQRLSPVPELYRVHTAKSTGVMAFMPLIAMLLCNHVWLLYAYAVENFFPLFAVCVFGDIALSLYIAIYAKWCEDRVHATKCIVAGALPFGLVTLYAILVVTEVIHQSRDSIGDCLGYLAVVTTFALFVSPFEKLRLVIATKSSAAIPILLCSIIFINSGLWLINGIVDSDLFIIVPNVVGVLLTAVQIGLYMKYRPNRVSNDAYEDLEAGVDQEITVTKDDCASSTSFAVLPSPKVVVN